MQNQGIEPKTYKLPPVYTRIGDRGTTQVGSSRLSKHHDRVKLVGKIQLSQTCIAELIAYWKHSNLPASHSPDLDSSKRKLRNDVDLQLERILHGLFLLGSQVGSSVLRSFYTEEGSIILQRWIEDMEKTIDLIQEESPAPCGFSWACTTDMLYNKTQYAMCCIRELESSISGEAVLDLTVFSAFFNRTSDLLYTVGVYVIPTTNVAAYYGMSKESLITFMRK